MITDIAHEATLDHPPERVWQALTDPRALAAWLMPNTLQEAKPGAKFRFTDKPRPFWDGICECAVAHAEPGQRLTLLWGTNTAGEPSQVSWILTPTPTGGTHIAFRHSRLHGVMGWLMKKGMTKGWQRMLTRSLPFVIERMQAGLLPTREDVTAVRDGKVPGA